MNYLKNIQEIRKEKGVSMEALSYCLGISQAAYYKIETGQSRLTIDRLYQIAEILKVGVEKLLELEHTASYEAMLAENAVKYQELYHQYQGSKQTYAELLKAKEEEIKSLIKLIDGLKK